ncbi:MAG TPA: glycosyltransferase family 2 protein, partial [Rhizomicrobium sp.]
MKISTVTVSFNSRATIARAVQSFLEQTHPDKEMLVVDGASNDGTLDIVRSFASDAIRVISEPDRGIYDAMNKGLGNFSGDAVGFLNSDDVYHDNSVLARIAQALESADAVHGDLVMVMDHVERRAVRTWRAGPFVPGSFRRGWMPPHPTFYIRRALAQAVGAFDLNYGTSADYDFMLRALELQAPRSAYIPFPLIDFMVGGASTKGVRAVVEANLGCLKSRRLHLGAGLID